ncbi:hypothetical protein J6590_000670 [Homalodisca vitripennis]|nr:hypothetical protein J6590_000670 [Homalodisca vitripennis]
MIAVFLALLGSFVSFVSSNAVDQTTTTTTTTSATTTTTTDATCAAYGKKTWHSISRRHLARDGRHLSRYGNRCLGSLMLRSLMRVHGGNSELPAMNRPLKELSLENSQSVFPHLPPQSVTDSASFLELSPNPPTLT